MFERLKEYTAAYVGRFPAREEDAGPAVRWTLEMTNRHQCGIAVVAPTQRHFRDHALLADLARGGRAETPKTLGSFPATEQVIIAFWPSENSLEQLDVICWPWRSFPGSRRTSWWRRARGAVDLLGGISPPAPAAIADPVVEAAMGNLTRLVNLSTGLAHPNDRSRAIEAFR